MDQRAVRSHPHTPPYTPTPGTIQVRKALRLPATIPNQFEVLYILTEETLEMRVKSPNAKGGLMTTPVAGRFEAELYELCLRFRGNAPAYMQRSKNGDATDMLVLADILSQPRKEDDFPVAGEVKVTYTPSFLDRLPLVDTEWEELQAMAGENTKAVNNNVAGGAGEGAGNIHAGNEMDGME